MRFSLNLRSPAEIQPVTVGINYDAIETRMSIDPYAGRRGAVIRNRHCGAHRRISVGKEFQMRAAIIELKARHLDLRRRAGRHAVKPALLDTTVCLSGTDAKANALVKVQATDCVRYRHRAVVDAEEQAAPSSPGIGYPLRREA